MIHTINNFIILLVFAYLRYKIIKRSNELKTKNGEINTDGTNNRSIDIERRRLKNPDAYSGNFIDMANEIGISDKTLLKAVDILEQLDLIVTDRAYRIKDEKGKYVLIPSPQVDDITTVMDEYPYINKKYCVIVTMDGKEADYEDGKQEDMSPEDKSRADEVISNLNNLKKKIEGIVSLKESLIADLDVLELLKEEDNHSFMGGDLHCVGRLDIDTEGLLLLTTDGSLTHKLISPKSEISKTYFIKLRDSVSLENQQKYIDSCKNGIDIPPEGNESGFFSLPAILKFDSDNSCFLTITEGKYHQVKRMIFALGNEVIYLKRTAIGGLKLDEKFVDAYGLEKLQ